MEEDVEFDKQSQHGGMRPLVGGAVRAERGPEKGKGWPGDGQTGTALFTDRPREAADSAPLTPDPEFFFGLDQKVGH